MPKVGLADRIFLLQESGDSPQHVSGLMVFQRPDGAGADYISTLAAEMAGHQEFAAPFNWQLRRPKLKSIGPSFRELPAEAVDLDYHFRRSALPSPGGERELGVLVSRLHSRQLDFSRPLWEVHLIEGLEGDRFAIFLKIHHALIDGVGAVRRLQQLLTIDPTDASVRPIWSIGPLSSSRRPAANSTKPAEKPDPMDALVGAAGDALTLGRKAGSMVKEAVRPSSEDLATPYQQPKTRFNGRIGQQRRVSTQTLDFDRVRAVGDKAGVSINDVYLGVCGGAVRRYLDDLGELPEKSMTAGTPVSIRLSEGDTSSNAFTLAAMNLRTDIADHVERLRAIQRSSDLAKENLKGLSKAAATNYGAMAMLPFVMETVTGLGGRLRPPYNLAISNVPGPLDQQYMAGASLERLTPFGLIYHGIAMMITAVTTSGKMSIGFVGDRDSLPHLQRIAVYTSDVLDEMEAALADAPVRRKRSGQKPKA